MVEEEAVAVVVESSVCNSTADIAWVAVEAVPFAAVAGASWAGSSIVGIASRAGAFAVWHVPVGRGGHPVKKMISQLSDGMKSIKILTVLVSKLMNNKTSANSLEAGLSRQQCRAITGH